MPLVRSRKRKMNTKNMDSPTTCTTRANLSRRRIHYPRNKPPPTIPLHAQRPTSQARPETDKDSTDLPGGERRQCLFPPAVSLTPPGRGTPQATVSTRPKRPDTGTQQTLQRLLLAPPNPKGHIFRKVTRTPLILLSRWTPFETCLLSPMLLAKPNRIPHYRARQSRTLLKGPE